jgi:hypothetical protein
MPAREGSVVARVGDATLTVDDLVERLQSQGSAAHRRYASRRNLRQFVEDQIRLELLVRAGLERGLANDPDVVQAARAVMVRKLLQHDLGPGVGGDDASEEEIVAYYERHADDYQQPEKRRFAHILLAPTEEGRAQAENILMRLEARPNERSLFRLQAARFSRDEESKLRGGEVSFEPHESLTALYGPSFADRVFKTAPGTLVTHPVQSTRGWHVLKVVSRREALARSLDEVREEIRERLLRGQRSKHFDKYLAEIKQRYPVALYEDTLDELLGTWTSAAPTRVQ